MKVRLLVTVAAVAAATVAPSPGIAQPAERAGAAITLGSVSAVSQICGIASPTIVQTEVAGDPAYVTPIAGVITSVSYYANATAGGIRVVFLKPGAVAGHWDSLGYTSELAVAPSVLNTFPTRTKIGAGITLALHVSDGNMACAGSAAAGDKVAQGVFDPVLGSDFTPAAPVANLRVNLSVTLEPDADNDGYGDVTQDLCPTSDLTHSSCDNVTEPDTAFTKKPAKRGTKHKIKAAFTSTVPGSTFECSIDQRAFKPCTSPYKKRVGFGKHILKVQAVGPAGLVDQTPVSAIFRVVRKPH